MNHDINVKKMRLNCFRQSKVPGEFMLQMRVPGGMVDAKYLSYVEYIANTWGDGNFHFGTRQTFDITGIKYENIPAVNAYLEQYIKEVDAELCGVNMDTVAHEPQPWDPKAGYPTIGARNITACVGNYHCICGNCNTFELARKIEPIIFPSHYHIKINIAGCPNDCNKAHLCGHPPAAHFPPGPNAPPHGNTAPARHRCCPRLPASASQPLCPDLRTTS